MPGERIVPSKLRHKAPATAQTNMDLAVGNLKEGTWQQAMVPQDETAHSDGYLGRIYPAEIHLIKNPLRVQPFFFIVNVGNHQIPANPPPYYPDLSVPCDTTDWVSLLSGEVDMGEKIGILNHHLLVEMGGEKRESNLQYLQQIFGIEKMPNTSEVRKSINAANTTLHFRLIGDLYRKVSDVETVLWRFTDLLEQQFNMILVPFAYQDFQSEYTTMVEQIKSTK